MILCKFIWTINEDLNEVRILHSASTFDSQELNQSNIFKRGLSSVVPLLLTEGHELIPISRLGH